MLDFETTSPGSPEQRFHSKSPGRHRYCGVLSSRFTPQVLGVGKVKHMKRMLAVVFVLSAVACGSNSSTNGGPPTAATPTRVINVTGALNFGQVTVGDAQTKTIAISNSGSDMLTVAGMTGPCGGSFSVSWSGGPISPGASQPVSVRFSPTATQNCSGVLTVNGDQTSGTNTLTVSATGVAGYSRNLSGRWRGMIGADTIVTLTHTGTALSGTFDSISLKGSVSGSVGNKGEVTMTVTVSGFQPFSLTGQADDAGNTISGQVNGSGFQNVAFTLKRL